jgi:hypothetical protein
MILSMPWSLRIALLLVLASAGAFVGSKRPFVCDAEKICKVAQLSACPEPESSLVSNTCKIAWLERSLWSFERLAQLPRGGGPGGGDFLRSLARQAGISACPEADVVDREYESRRQQAEEARRASSPPELEGDSSAEPTERRTTGIVKREAPAVDGELDPSVISQEVRARIGAVKACYERALKRNSNLSGKVKIRWTIGATGAVSAVEVEEDGMGDAGVAACLEGLVRHWRFPAPSRGSVDVVYPFVFEVAR